jgi:hypothetical protein
MLSKIAIAITASLLVISPALAHDRTYDKRHRNENDVFIGIAAGISALVIANEIARQDDRTIYYRPPIIPILDPYFVPLPAYRDYNRRAKYTQLQVGSTVCRHYPDGATYCGF